ncbi:hypothetical protein F9231_17405 [Bacillus safensis]|uniref:DUF6731 family protein n=1 Tax=Bacillus TaxID=1386 RepID=UPI00125D7FA0|nr:MULTISPECIES: DUF6731 family protein [Bacillus]KAB3536359.1 hypothetical protein F9229_15915 [Bacillus safensis]KAB3543336.1 hypothetical protein F9231_17405 [Bacillus safensis]MBS4743003.1 hypothetical protein [Bacillus safensis]MED1577695.1 hypothetical protein [Bacillus safensis]NRF06036.1 hypothetical protein [Bacillus safensis]
MSQKKVRFEYYQVVFVKKEDDQNGRERLFDLLPWMAKANQKSLEGRTYDYRQEQARLEEATWDDELQIYYLHFVRLRDHIPSTAKTSEKVIPLELEDDEYIGEEVSALYDESNHVLMLQRNKYSLGPEGIEDYLNLIWNSEEETIYLRAICPPNIFENAKKSAQYRKITLKFADLKKHNGNSNGFLGRLKSPVSNLFQSFNKYEGVNAQITITVGNTKNSLDEEAIHETLNDLQEHRDLFSGAELARRSNVDTPVELIDLFEHKAHDFGTFRMEKRQTLNHHSIVAEMWKIYGAKEGCRNRQRDINSYLRG